MENTISKSSDSSNFNIVMNRLKGIFSVEFDKDMAELLGISRVTYSERATRNSLPYEKIIELCLSKGINVNYVFGIKNDFQKIKSGVAQEKIKKYINYKAFGNDELSEPFAFANEFCDDPEAKLSAVVADNIHMFPIIDVADIVIVNEHKKEISEDGKLFLIKYKSNIAVARILRTIEPNEVIMEFENPLLENIKTKLKNLTVLGKVISVHRSMV